jgi:hypothetical protein
MHKNFCAKQTSQQNSARAGTRELYTNRAPWQIHSKSLPHKWQVAKKELTVHKPPPTDDQSRAHAKTQNLRCCVEMDGTTGTFSEAVLAHTLARPRSLTTPAQQHRPPQHQRTTCTSHSAKSRFSFSSSDDHTKPTKSSRMPQQKNARL